MGTYVLFFIFTRMGWRYQSYAVSFPFASARLNSLNVLLHLRARYLTLFDFTENYMDGDSLKNVQPPYFKKSFAVAWFVAAVEGQAGSEEKKTA